MTEIPEAPGSAELHSRLARLETQNAELTARIEDLKQWSVASDKFLVRQAKQVGDVLESIGLIELRLLNLTAKIFPGTIQTEQQIAEIVDPIQLAWKQEKDRSAGN